jgi:hypothetical protein
MRGADVYSDHHLVIAVRLRLNRYNIKAHTKFNVRLLRSKDTLAAFKISLSNRFQPLQELIEDKENDIA